MARISSNLICKCGRKGGFLTKRRAGYGNKHEYFYVGHYDPAKKGRVWCSLSFHDFAHITFNYVEYSTQYKPLIEKLYSAKRLHAPKESRDKIFEDAALLLARMHRKLTPEMLATKVWADVEELLMLEKIKEADGVGLTTDHNVISRSLRGLPVTPQRLWCNHPHYQNWPKRKSRKRYTSWRVETKPTPS